MVGAVVGAWVELGLGDEVCAALVVLGVDIEVGIEVLNGVETDDKLLDGLTVAELRVEVGEEDERDDADVKLELKEEVEDVVKEPYPPVEALELFSCLLTISRWATASVLAIVG